MKGKLLFATGLAAGYVLGSRSGRAAYDKLKARSAELWHSKPVQDKVAAAAETVKDKAPEVSEHLGEAARRAGTVISSAVHRDAGHGSTSAATPGTATPREQPRPERRHPRPAMSIPTLRSPTRTARTGRTRAAPPRRARPPTWTGTNCPRGSLQGPPSPPSAGYRPPDGQQRAGHHGGPQLLRAQHPGRQSVPAKDSGRLRGLPAAGLYQHVAAGRQPLPRAGGDPPLHLKPVGAAVEAGPRLMDARFLRHGFDVRRGNVGGVDGQQPDPAPEARRERSIEIALVDLPAQRQDVGARTRHGRGVDIGAVEFGGAGERRERRTDSAGPAAEIDNDRCRGVAPAPCAMRPAAQRPAGRGIPSGGGARRLRCRPRCGVRRIPPSRECVQGEGRQPSGRPSFERLRRRGCVDQQAGFVFGKHAAGCTEPGREYLVRGKMADYWHGSAFRSGVRRPHRELAAAGTAGRASFLDLRERDPPPFAAVARIPHATEAARGQL